MTSDAVRPEDYCRRIGELVGLSDWIAVPQTMIDAFAELTDDHQAIHLDATAARAAGFDGPIAHGFLSLSLLSRMAADARPRLAGLPVAVNYGFERIRFVTPVPAGARLRGRFVLAEALQRGAGEWSLRHQVEVEIEGGARPALVADWLTRHYAG